MASERVKTLAKDLLPPAVSRLFASTRATRPEKATRAVRSEITKEANLKGREQAAEWYDESFLANDHWRWHYTKSRYYPMWAVICDRVMRADAKSVLDVGCGPGQFASLLRDQGLPSYLGIDFSPQRAEWARKVCPESEFVVADAFETDLFSDHAYDTVVSTEFLEHVQGDIQIIERIRPGSRFYGSVPNFPYTSHVRHFKDVQEVRDRYGGYFDSLNVDVFRHNQQGLVFYLLEGVKR